MMSSWLTTIVFAAVTLLVVIWHVRRTTGDGPSRCPACDSPVAPGAAHCPACDVPQQIFEITTAKRAEPETEAKSTRDTDQLHAIVRADCCVGCGACVPVCPEAGAIRVENKIAIVDSDLCKGHGDCVEACPVGGILLGSGDMVHRVTVPDVQLDFQTRVPGVYIIGELGGRGLIKNAINEGRVAVEFIARELKEEGDCGHSLRVVDVAIVGSGPAGLSAALTAKREGLTSIIFEQGTVSDSIRKYPRHKLLLAEPLGVPLYGELWVADATKETLLSVWEATIADHDLDIRANSRVQDIARHGGLLEVRGDGFVGKARRVILALGRRGTPRRLGVPGEELNKVFYDIVEMEQFAGRRVLVVGGGDSAIESCVGLSNQPGTEVTLSYRRDNFDRAKERNVSKLKSATEAGQIRVLLQSQITQIDPDQVTLDVAGQPCSFPNDDVIIRVGGEPPTRFLESIGVSMVTKEIPIVEAQAGVAD